MGIFKIVDFFKSKLINQTSGSVGIDLSKLDPELRAALRNLEDKSPSAVQALIDQYRR